MSGSAAALNLSLENTGENLISRFVLHLIFSVYQVKVKNQHIFIIRPFTELSIEN